MEKPDVVFKDVPNLPGFQEARFRAHPSSEELRIVSLGPNMFHVVRADRPTEGGATVVINNRSEKKTKNSFFELLDYLAGLKNPPTKTGCWQLVVIETWPDGWQEINLYGCLNM